VGNLEGQAAAGEGRPPVGGTVMDLVISEPERTLLLRILEGSLGDLRSEVRRTRAPAWHDGLKQEEHTLQGLLERLRTE
jgi:hypothetical protein